MNCAAAAIRSDPEASNDSIVLVDAERDVLQAIPRDAPKAVYSDLAVQTELDHGKVCVAAVSHSGSVVVRPVSAALPVSAAEPQAAAYNRILYIP